MQQMLVSTAGHDELFEMNPATYERRVMICIDDSDPSRYALHWSISNILSKTKDFIYILNVATTKLDKPKSIRILKNALSEMKANGFANIRYISSLGKVHTEIARFVDEFLIDFLVIGYTPEEDSWSKKWLNGSTGEFCVTKLKCTVLVIKDVAEIKRMEKEKNAEFDLKRELMGPTAPVFPKEKGEVESGEMSDKGNKPEDNIEHELTRRGL